MPAAYLKTETEIEAGGIKLERKTGVVKFGNREIQLADSERKTLEIFMRLKDLILSSREIYREYNDYQIMPRDERHAAVTAAEMIKRLRRILGSNVIRTHYGDGAYSFVGLASANLGSDDDGRFINYRGLLFSPSTNQVKKDGQVNQLRAGEGRILLAMVQEPERVFTIEELAEIADVGISSIAVTLSGIRSKAGRQFIRTVKGGQGLPRKYQFGG